MELLPVLLLCFILWRPGLGNQQWEGKIENILLSLQVNFRSLEERMSQLNVMEHALKINNIDTKLEGILKKVEENDNKLLALQSEVERLSQQLSSRSRDKSTPDRPDESKQDQRLVLEKVDGYGQKILRAHQTLLDILKVTNEKLTNGLNKMFEKFTSFVQLKSLENSFQRVAQNVEIVHGKINSITTANSVTSTLLENLQVLIENGFLDLQNILRKDLDLRNTLSGIKPFIENMQKEVMQGINIGKQHSTEMWGKVVEIFNSTFFPASNLRSIRTGFEEIKTEVKKLGNLEIVVQQANSATNYIKDEIDKFFTFNPSVQSQMNQLKLSLDTIKDEWYKLTSNLNDSMKMLDNVFPPLQNVSDRKEFCLPEAANIVKYLGDIKTRVQHLDTINIGPHQVSNINNRLDQLKDLVTQCVFKNVSSIFDVKRLPQLKTINTWTPKIPLPTRFPNFKEFSASAIPLNMRPRTQIG